MTDCKQNFRLVASSLLVACLMSLISTSAPAFQGELESQPKYSRELIVRLDDSYIDRLDSIVQNIRNGEWSDVPIPSITLLKPVHVEYFVPRFSRHDTKDIDTPRAQLSRFLVLTVAKDADLHDARQLLAGDQWIRSVSRPIEYALASTAGTTCEPPSTANPQPISQYSADIDWGRDMLQVDQAYSYQHGYSTVALVDFGIHEEHGAFMAFDGGSYIGGNFLPHFSFQTGARVSEDFNQPAHPFLG